MVKRWGVPLFAFACVVLSFPYQVSADVVSKCVTLMDATDQAASTTGSIVTLLDFDLAKVDAEAFTGIASADNDSGTLPTLDVVIQTCETANTATCADTPISFTQCTTGTCYGSDGIERIDLNKTSVNVFPYFRAKTTLAGTNPVYDVTVRLCYH